MISSTDLISDFNQMLPSSYSNINTYTLWSSSLLLFSMPKKMEILPCSKAIFFHPLKESLLASAVLIPGGTQGIGLSRATGTTASPHRQ